MTDPLIASVEELSKFANLALRFIDGDDIEEFNSELVKLGIEPGIGARAKEALAAPRPLTPREIKMAGFLATDTLNVLSLAEGALMVSRNCEFDPRMVVAAGKSGVPITEIAETVEEAKKQVSALHSLLISSKGPLADFTEEEAAVIRKAAGR